MDGEIGANPPRAWYANGDASRIVESGYFYRGPPCRRVINAATSLLSRRDSCRRMTAFLRLWSSGRERRAGNALIGPGPHRLFGSPRDKGKIVGGAFFKRCAGASAGLQHTFWNTSRRCALNRQYYWPVAEPEPVVPSTPPPYPETARFPAPFRSATFAWAV